MVNTSTLRQASYQRYPAKTIARVSFNIRRFTLLTAVVFVVAAAVAFSSLPTQTPEAPAKVIAPIEAVPALTYGWVPGVEVSGE